MILYKGYLIFINIECVEMFINAYSWNNIKMKTPKNLYFEEKDVNDWEQFCEENFKSKRVLSKVIKEAMDEYIKNFKLK